jgi:molybdate transport system ATP-binding protein
MADGLRASFEKRFPSGTTVRAALEIPGGGTVTILFGPSGSGKTTILRCLAGLDVPEAGSIRFGDEVWFDRESGVDLPPQRRRVGLLFQEYALFPHLTVAGNVAYGLANLPRTEREERVSRALGFVGLADLERRHPNRLSGGERQRVALARALAVEPRLLLLDEPLSALDASQRETLRRELRGLLTRLSIPSLVVTHDRLEALALGDHMIVVAGGEVRQSGAVPAVFSRPADADVARIVGVETVVPGRVVGSRDGLLTVETPGPRLQATDTGDLTGDVLVCIRAEDVVLERGAGTGLVSARNRLPARVTATTSEGPLVRILLDCGGLSLAALVTRPAFEEMGLAPGALLEAVVKAPNIHLVARADASGSGPRPPSGTNIPRSERRAGTWLSR